MKRIVVLIAVSGSLAFASSGHAANQATELGDHKKALSELEKLGGSVASSKSPIRPALMPVPPRSALSGVSSVQGSFLVRGQRPGWSPDGKKIVFGRSGNDNGILIYDVATKKTVPFATPEKTRRGRVRTDDGSPMSPDRERRRPSGRPKFPMASHSAWRPDACRHGRPTARRYSSRHLTRTN